MLPLFLMIHCLASRRRILGSTSKRKKIYKKGAGNECCRTCFSTKNLEAIFSKGDYDKRCQELRIVTGLEIKLNDGQSQNICRGCNRTIKTALRFRRNSQKTEKIRLGVAVKPENEPNCTSVKIEPMMDNLEDNNEFQSMGFIDRYQNYNFPDIFDICKTELVEAPAQSKPIDVGSFKCKVCSEGFRSRKLFIEHRKIHKRLWVCEECGKPCRSNFELKNHKRAKHGMERIHKCPHCDYTPATQEALTIHLRRHTGERPYVCDHCAAAFFRRNTLVQHLASHLSDNKYQCNLCSKRFKSKNFLQIHKHDTHTGKKYSYLCSLCDHRFQKPYKVRAHTRKVHGVPDEEQGPVVRIVL